jgi:predicted HTH domain antitoxin
MVDTSRSGYQKYLPWGGFAQIANRPDHLSKLKSMEAWKTKDFVSAGLYEDEKAVVQDAMRALLSERPQLRLELAIHRYQDEEISLAKAAALAGVSWERMREILQSRGIQPRLGPETEEEAYLEIRAMERIIREDTG